ncbi:MAG: lipopolysaccharide kinase InaA family protein [Acidobacteriota bacterium]
MRLQRFRGKLFHGWIHPEFSPPFELLEDPELAKDAEGAQCLLESEGRRIVRLPLRVNGSIESCFAYYFKNSSFSRSLRQNYAFRSLRLSSKLIQRGIGSFEILAALKRRDEWLNWHSFVVAREIKAVYEMPSAENHAFNTHPVIEFSPAVASALASELAEFHREGFFHGDLKTRHILVYPRQNPGLEFYFVDLEKCHYLPRIPAVFKDILIVRDLVQLFASLPADYSHVRDQFMHEYLRALKLPPRRQRRLGKLLNLYGPEGPLKQGQTLLEGAFRKLTSTGQRIKP